MLQIAEFFPILAFLLGYEFVNLSSNSASVVNSIFTGGIDPSVAAFVFGSLLATVVSIIQLAVTFFIKKFNFIQILSTSLIFLFGVSTIYMQGEIFFRSQATFYFLFAAVMIINRLKKKKINHLKTLFESEVKADDATWKVAQDFLIFYCVAIALANSFFSMRLTTEAWVWFRVLTPTLGFIFVSLIIRRKLLKAANSAPSLKELLVKL